MTSGEHSEPCVAPKAMRHAAMSTEDIGLGVLAAVIWGMTFVVTAAALERVPPILFTALRFSAAAAFIALVPRPPMPWRTIVLAGMLLGAGQYGFLFMAMASGVPPGMAAVLVHTQAIIMVGLAAMVFGERLQILDFVALGLALVGLVVLAFAKDLAKAHVGFSLVLVAAFCGATGNLVLKRAGSANSLGLAVWMSAVPPLPLFALSFLLEGQGRITTALVNADWIVAGAVVYSAVLATVVAFSIWGRLFSRYPSARTAPFLLMVPFVGLASSVDLLGETLSGGKALGSGLVLASVGLAAATRGRIARTKSTER